MEEWKEYKLSEVASLTTGFPFDGHKYGKEGIRVVRGDNVTIGSLRWDTDKDKRWNEPFDRASEFSLYADDIVIGMDGSRVGRNRAQVKQEDLPLYIAQRVACIRHNDMSLQTFLYYQIFNQAFENYIKAVHTGTSIPHVSLKQIGDYPIILPSLKVQQRIASILKSFDDKIEKNRRVNLILEQQAQALFKSWFVEFEPYKDGEFVESELGLIPKGWRVGTLFDVAEILDKYRKPLSGRDRESMKKTYPYYGATSCMDYVDDYIFDGIYTLIGEDGSVVKEDGFPYMQYVWGKLWVNNHAHILQGKNGFSTEMLHVLLSLTNIRHLVTGAVQAKLSQANMQKILVPIPPMGVLDVIRPVIDILYQKKRIIEDESHNLSSIRDTLLPQLMSGELRVPDTYLINEMLEKGIR